MSRPLREELFFAASPTQYQEFMKNQPITLKIVRLGIKWEFDSAGLPGLLTVSSQEANEVWQESTKMSNSQSSGKDAYMSVQIVVLDHYQVQSIKQLINLELETES